jgi:hypothetical protein
MKDGFVYETCQVLLMRVEGGDGMHAIVTSVVRSDLLVEM